MNQILDLNVGGVCYTTTLSTLTRYSDSRLAKIVHGRDPDVPRLEHNGKTFIDRDGVLFRYVLDFLRNQKLTLPEHFQERERLRQEAEYYQLPAMFEYLSSNTAEPATAAGRNGLNNSSNPAAKTTAESGCIIIGYRGTFSFGRDGGVADVKFRKLLRILVSGRVALCKEVFQDTLNESRDPDRGDTDRYTSRFFLKHLYLEQAFDMLHVTGFRMVGACGSGTNSAGDMKPGMDSEESKWNHYNEFVFVRP